MLEYILTQFLSSLYSPTFWLSIVTGCMTILSQWLLAHRDIKGWYISLANQVLWLAFVLMTGGYGLLIINGFMTYIGIKAIRNWRK